MDLVADMLTQGATLNEILEWYPQHGKDRGPLYLRTFPRRGRPARRPWQHPAFRLCIPARSYARRSGGLQPIDSHYVVARDHARHRAAGRRLGDLAPSFGMLALLGVVYLSAGAMHLRRRLL